MLFTSVSIVSVAPFNNKPKSPRAFIIFSIYSTFSFDVVNIILSTPRIFYEIEHLLLVILITPKKKKKKNLGNRVSTFFISGKPFVIDGSNCLPWNQLHSIALKIYTALFWYMNYWQIPDKNLRVFY